MIKNIHLQHKWINLKMTKKDSVTMSNATNTLGRTSETNSDTNLINNIIPQTYENM